MITGQSDPLMYFNTFLLLAFGLKSTAKPGGAMLPLAPPLLPRNKTRGCTAPSCSPPLASLLLCMKVFEWYLSGQPYKRYLHTVR